MKQVTLPYVFLMLLLQFNFQNNLIIKISFWETTMNVDI